jgi:L-asparaginase
MDKTATFLSQFQFEKQIILVGAMEPYLINPIEGVGNLMQAYGFLLGNDFNGIYISMHGIVSSFEKIKKNKELGVFECHL